MNQLLSIFEMSVIMSLIALAAVFTFRFAGFPDLSVDGVFTLGAVVFVKFMLFGFGVLFSFIAALLAGALAGCITAFISVRLKINPLLASVLILIILYSLNLRILGKANQPLYNFDMIGWFKGGYWILLMALGIFFLFVLVYTFFRTQIGSAIRTVGSSPEFLVSVGRNVTLYKVFLVSFGSGIVAVSGSLLSFKYGFADVSLGMGTIIIGIASLIIGEKICGREKLFNQIVAAYIGTFLYQLAVGVALSAGISPTDVKLVTGIITIGLLALGKDEEERLFT